MLTTMHLCRRLGTERLAATRPPTSALQRVRPHHNVMRVAARALRTDAARGRTHAPAQRFTMQHSAKRQFADATVPVTFVDSRDGQTIEVEAEVGKTVLEAALDHDVDIEAACGGELACSTCHVILEQELYDALEPPDEEEEDMLDLAWGLEDTSRLCCQIKVSPELKGATFVIPEDPDI